MWPEIIVQMLEVVLGVLRLLRIVLSEEEVLQGISNLLYPILIFFLLIRYFRSIQPTLADLEFPPPPTDLPPPPEEFDGIDQVDCSTSIMTSSQELRKRIIPISPLTTKKISREPKEPQLSEPSETSDVSTLQPSVEEASSRFGVSLKKRDMDKDVKEDSGKEGKEKSPQRASLSLTSPSQDGKSPISGDSDVPAVGSPLEPLPPPPNIGESGELVFCLDI